MAAARGAGTPWNSRGPARVVVLQLKRLGDLILATPALRTLNEAWPAARLTVVTESPFDQALEGLPGLEEVLCHPRGIIESLALGRRLRALDAECVLDFYGSVTSARLALTTGAPVRVGWARRGRRFAYTHAVPIAVAEPPRFTADQKLDLLRAIGLSPTDATPRLAPVPLSGSSLGPRLVELGLAGRRFLVVAPASRREYKRWSAAAWAQVIRGFRASTGGAVCLAGGPGEEAQLAEVMAHFPDAEAPAMISVPTLAGWRTLLPAAALFIGPDGGARQLAQALGVPTVGLFGPQHPAHWVSPVPAGRHIGLRAREADCAGRCARTREPCACLARLAPEKVVGVLCGQWQTAIGRSLG